MAVCYQLLTGQTPYDGLGGRVVLADQQSDQHIVLTPASKQLRHPATLPVTARHELDALLQRGLAVEPTQRFDTTTELITALTRTKQSLVAPPTPLSAVNRLLLAGKHPNKVKVACAREMVGFVWESLNKVAA